MQTMGVYMYQELALPRCAADDETRQQFDPLPCYDWFHLASAHGVPLHERRQIRNACIWGDI